MAVSTPTHTTAVRRALALPRPVLVLLAVGAILLIGALGPWPFLHSAGQVDVNLGPGDRFTPAAITVHEGDTVTWHWGGSTHTVTADGGPGQAWDSGLKSSGTFSHTFDRAGTFPYVCQPHAPKMSGTVVVLPAETNAAAPTGTQPAVSSPAAPGQPTATASPAAAPTSPAGAAPTAPGAAAAPPKIAALRLSVPRGCRTGKCAAVARVNGSEAGTLFVRGRGRRLASIAVASGVHSVRIPLARLPRGRASLKFVLVDPEGNRSPAVTRAVTVH